MPSLIIVIYYRFKYQYERWNMESTAEIDSLLLDSSN